jgi:AbrB family looped-hinge helix DNA binding protein
MNIDPECLNIQIFWNVVVGAKWQIVIPSEVRKALNLTPGDSLIVTVKHGKAIGLIKSTDVESFVEMMQDEIKNIK